MSDKPTESTDSGSSYGGASSPYDQPTESLSPQPTQRSTSVPRTDDELGFGGGEPHRSSSTNNTEKLPKHDTPNYETQVGDGSHPTERFATAAPYADPNAVDPRHTDPGYTDPRYTDPGFAEPTQQFAPATAAAPLAAASVDDRRDLDAREKRGTTDLGLLILRLAVGVIAFVHGLQKLTGWWSGPGLDGFQDVLASSGFDQTRVLAIAGAVGEVAGGALLILGLATPLAAASIVAVMINAWCVRQVGEPGLQFFAPNGVEYETLLAVAAASIALTGPGRIALDGGRRWARRPFVGSLVALILGIAGGAAIWIFLNGANPLV